MKGGLVTVERKNDYAVILLNRPPVNAMSLELWQELAECFYSVESDDTMHGVIFGSGLERNIFTAGIDLHELMREYTSEERVMRFWTTLTRFLARVYRSRLFTIAAVKGQCPAGGCALALTCDYRIMTENGSIGLNETRIGIPVPATWAQLFCKIVGNGRGEMLLLGGENTPARKALEIGLVHEVLGAGDSSLHDRADQVMAQKLKSNFRVGTGAIVTKAALRDDFSRYWESQAEEEARGTWEITGNPTVNYALKAYKRALSKM